MTDTPTAPVTKPKGRKVRMRLKSVMDTSIAMGVLIREWRAGVLDSQELSRVCNCLALLSRNISDSSVEERLRELEDAHAQQHGFRRGAA
jgi:hypothetical protein